MRLKDLRVDKDLYQKDIAKILGMTQQQYSLYELNQRDLPTDCLIKLAMYYNTSVDYLLGITDNSQPYQRNKAISYNNYCVLHFIYNKKMSIIDIFLNILIMLIY